MSRIIKVVILSLMLAIPMCIILFLHFFGKNEYALPIFHEDGLNACISTTTPHTIPDFALSSTVAERITSEVLEGKISAVHFFDAACKDNCSSIFDALANLHSVFADNDLVQILSISKGLVPEDTLQAFARQYKSDAEKWLFLNENQDEALDLAKCGFGLDQQSVERSMATVVLVDTQKRIRGYYNLIDPEEINRLVLEVRILLQGLNTLNYAEYNE